MQTTPTTTESTPTQSVRPPLTPEALQALLTTPVKLETKQPTRYYVKQPQHKGRVEGAANYNVHDTDLLLNVIERIKPIGGMMWQKVEEQFNAHANVQRPLKSLKEKFKSLRLTRYSTGDPHMPEAVRRAKQLYDNILSEHKVTEIGTTLSPSSPVVVDTSPDSSPTASPHSELNTTTATTSSDSVSSTAVRLSSLRFSASHKHPRNDESPSTTSASDAESTTPYTSAHKRRRRLEDAVFAIAESCKRDNDKTEQHNSVVSMLSSMQQQQQLFMQQQQQQQQQLLQQFMNASQQQQQFQAIQQQQQQQFFIQLLDKLTQTQSSTQQQKSDQQ